MNILTEKLPGFLVSGNKKYMLNTGFKNWVMAGHLAGLQTGRREDVLKILFLCYKRKLPPSLSEACRGIAEFYSGAFGDGCDKKEVKKDFKSGEKLFDFYYDSKYIYSDFLGVYGIDLNSENIHFYKFCALFEGLPENSRIMKIMKIRAMDLSEIKAPELKQKYIQLKRIYSLCQYMPEHIKRRRFGEALGIFF